MRLLWRIPFLIISLFFNVAIAQNKVIKGKIIDHNSKEPLAFSNIGFIQKGIGTAADAEGNFTLTIPTELSTSTLTVSALGYDKKTFIPDSIYETTITISLQKNPYELAEVVIPTTITETQIGTTLKQRTSSVSPWSPTPGGQIAACFTPTSYPVKIKNVNFFVTKDGKPNTSFRVRIYKNDGPDGAPGTDIINENILVTPEKGNEWVTVDMQKYKLWIDDGSFCVAMEWYAAPREKGQEAQFLGVNMKKSNRISWWLSPFSKWIRVEKAFVDWGDRDVMINATLLQ